VREPARSVFRSVASQRAPENGAEREEEPGEGERAEGEPFL
jgi:hypothetical protein